MEYQDETVSSGFANCHFPFNGPDQSTNVAAAPNCVGREMTEEEDRNLT